jgi:tight adherence protein B
VLIPGLTFLLVLGIVLGMYWVFVARPERATDAALRRRLVVSRRVERVETEGVERKAERLSNLPLLNRLLTHRADLVQPFARLVQQSGVKTTVGVIVLAAGCLAMLGVLIGQLWTRTLWFGLLLGLVLAVMPYLFLQWKRSRRVQRFEELFPEALGLMSRAMRAGHTFQTALGMVAEELPEPIAPEFKILHDQQNFGMPMNEALRDFGERVPLLAAKFFVTAILTQRESGGNLTEVLDNLASVIRDRFMVMRQIQIKSAHGRMTGWVLVGLPPALALAFSILNPGHFGAMIGDRLGTQMIFAAVVLQIVGALVIRKIVRIEY